jgi:predicted TIM-barrel fold metal-dependent hydrolase
MVSAQISSPLERVLFLCAECHPLLSHFKELTVILAHMGTATMRERLNVQTERFKSLATSRRQKIVEAEAFS